MSGALGRLRGEHSSTSRRQAARSGGVAGSGHREGRTRVPAGVRRRAQEVSPEVGIERATALRPPSRLNHGMVCACATMTASESDGVTKKPVRARGAWRVARGVRGA
eukprot:4806929-Prymnesium_polylepis.1